MKLTRKALTVLLASTMALSTINAVYANEIQIEQQQYSGTICIDYGHYYGEPGKRSGDGTGEIVFNMGVGKKVVEILNKEVPYVRVYESNPVGQDTTISDRAKKAQAEGAEFMVSLHMNAASHEANWQDRVNGTHIMFREDVSEEHKALAKAYLNHYADSMGYRKHRGTGYEEVEPDNFGLLDYGSDHNFAVFIHEMQFMDNKEYADFFLTEEGQTKAARAIADAIKEVYIDKYIEKPVSNVQEELKEDSLDTSIKEEVPTEQNVEDGTQDISFINEEDGTLSLDKLILSTQEELKATLINGASETKDLTDITSVQNTDISEKDQSNIEVKVDAIKEVIEVKEENEVKETEEPIKKEDNSILDNIIDKIRPKDKLSLDIEEEDIIISEKESFVEKAISTINEVISRPSETEDVITSMEIKEKQVAVQSATDTITSKINNEEVNQFKEDLKAGDSQAQQILAKIQALNEQLKNK